jgi:hypothetical protein
MTSQEPKAKTESPWQKLPAVIVTIFHALAGIVATGVLFANNDPAAGAAAGGSSAVAVLTSIILASHMFAPASVRRISGYISFVDAVAPKVISVLDQIKTTMDARPAPATLETAQLVAPVPPVVMHLHVDRLTDSGAGSDAENAPDGLPELLPAYDNRMGREVDESPAG